jgi:thiamine biosynthesis lipoprotein ApbE
MSIAIYIQLSHLRINLVLCLTLAACSAPPRPAVSRAWPAMNATMSAAVWGRNGDSTRVVRALDAARDSVDSLDARLTRRARVASLDSIQRAIKARTGVTLVLDSIVAGYALDRAARVMRDVVDSGLLALGDQYLWIGPATTHTSRPVGIPHPDNSLDILGYVMLERGSIRIASRARSERKARTASVTVLAPDALSATAWAEAFLVWGCDSALANAQGYGVVCADSTGVRWTTDLQNRVSLPSPSRAGRGP